MAIYQDGGFGDFGFSIKKSFKRAKKALKKAVKGPAGIARAVFAPIAIGVTAPATGVAYLGRKAGIKPLRKVHAALKEETKKQAVVVGAHIAVGAVLGTAYLAAPLITAAPVTSGVAGGGGLLGTAAEFAKKEAAELAKKEAAGLLEKGTEAAQALLGAGAKPEEVAAMTPAQQEAAAAALKTPKGPVTPLVAAGIGLVAAGPLGAGVGFLVGSLMSKE